MMLSTQASTFRHKSRLAISLSWVAGYTNVIVLMLTGQTISHMTGNSTRFGNSIGNLLLHHSEAGDDLILFSLIIGSFFLGGVVSGLMTERPHRGRGSKYALPIMLEAILLAMLVILLLLHHSNIYLLTGSSAFAMGLQNATITRVSGAVVRTTHLTGVITDLGLELVLVRNWWRASGSLAELRSQPNAQRFVLLASILGSFLFGVVAGTMGFEKVGSAALLAPVLFLTLIVLRDFFKRSK